MQQLPIREITNEEILLYGLKEQNKVRKDNPVAHLESVFKRRAFYTVVHAVVKFERGRIELVPVHPFFHADKQFTSAPAHYHIDGRFESTQSFRTNYDGTTLQAIFAPGAAMVGRIKVDYNVINDESYQVNELIYIRRKCIRLTTGLDLGRGPIKKFDEWRASMIGKSCAGKKCPHYGTTMIDQDGKLVCPMHNLVGSKETMQIIAND